MKTFSTVAVLLFVFVPSKSLGQTNSAPVTVLKTDARAGHQMDCSAGLGCSENPYIQLFSVQYRNDSSKEIAAVEFEVVFIDVLQDKHDSRTGYMSEKSLKPGKTHTSKWSNILYDYAKTVEARPTKVVFKDGTKWVASAK